MKTVCKYVNNFSEPNNEKKFCEAEMKFVCMKQLVKESWNKCSNHNLNPFKVIIESGLTLYVSIDK